MEGNKTAGIIISVVAIIAIVGGIVWVMNMDEESTDQSDMTTQNTQTEEQAPGNIVVVASEADSLSTLVTAVKAADLVETLQSEGPFTVFAPTNKAFDALPDGTLDTLLEPENVDQLKSILTYHVVADQVLASDLEDGQEITTVQGGKLTVSISDGKVYLVDAKDNKVMVEKADVNADNGVVHIIDGVLMPN